MGLLRLGVYYHIFAYRKDDDIYLPGFFGCFLDSLAEHCQTLTCFLHAASPGDEALCDYRLKSPNITWVNLGPSHSAPYRTLFSGRFTRHVRPYLSSLDVILLRGPSPLLPAMAAAAGKLPVVLLLVGDYLAGIDSVSQPSFRKTLIRLWAWWNARGQSRAARRSLTLVNSHKLFEELQPSVPNLAEIRTTTLNDTDFFERSDTCQSSPVRLLYTGRLSASKGLFDIVDAMSILLAQGNNIRLELAGWPDKGEEHIVEELTHYADQKGVAGRVVYLGYKALGPELFACYRHADIYVLASRSSFEGFPRTIWEAMANSLPVIATRVGSIPAFVEEAAELVPPGQAELLAEAISKLIHHPELRQKLIVRGLDLARGNTLETQVGVMVAKMKTWLDVKNG